MSGYVTRKTPGDTRWFTQDRFGMFIHWGLYAMPARSEWVKKRERIPEETYDRYLQYFNPDLYDARDWARRAKAAGMKYAVLTTKHHEGFCMFDSAYTDYKCTNTPAKRDLVREYVNAFRAEGLRVGFYYSLIDWHHPEFPIDHLHPRRDDENARELSEKRDVRVYAQYMRNQVRELLTNYGKIDILWFDYSYDAPKEGKYAENGWMRGKGKDEWQSEALIQMARELQPDIIIDNRAQVEQDLWTPEQYQPMEWVRHQETGELVNWEACQTFSGTWGYHRDESTWKSPEMLIRMLVNTVSFGGNLLMNVGPTARGYLDDRAKNALGVFEEWMQYHSRAIYNCTMAEPEFTAPADCRLTQSVDGRRLYVHLFAYPYRYLQLKGFAGKVDYAQFLHDGSELIMIERKIRYSGSGDANLGDTLLIQLPDIKPNTRIPVIELFLK